MIFTGFLCSRNWQIRRVRWTSTAIQFCRAGQSQLFDLIPMHEILSVVEMCDNLSSSPWSSSCEQDGRCSSKNRDSISKLRLQEDGLPIEKVSSDGEQTQKSIPRKFASRQVNTLQIKTIDDGYNSGRVYYLRAKTNGDCQEIIASLKRLASAARQRADVRSRFELIQSKIKLLYDSTTFQMLVAALITTVCTNYCQILLYSSNRRSTEFPSQCC